jgi:hypothetical protein
MVQRIVVARFIFYRHRIFLFSLDRKHKRHLAVVKLFDLNSMPHQRNQRRNDVAEAMIPRYGFMQ